MKSLSSESDCVPRTASQCDDSKQKRFPLPRRSSSEALRLRKQSHALHVRSQSSSSPRDLSLPILLFAEGISTQDIPAEAHVVVTQHAVPATPAREDALCVVCGDAKAVDSHHLADCQRGTCNHSLCARAQSSSLSTPFHLQSYDNHLSRMSMCDLDEDDEYGHYSSYEEDAHSGGGAAGGGYTHSHALFPGIAAAAVSGVYLEDEESPRRYSSSSLAATTMDSLAAHAALPPALNTLTPRKPPPPHTNTLAEHDAMTMTTTTSESVPHAEEVVSVDCMRAVRNSDDESDEEMGVHIACIIENRGAQLFCRSFSEHYRHVTVDVPVCLGVVGLRIIQEPYCRLFSVAEYKLRVIINHQEYCVWKRYEDFVRLAASCQRMMRFYEKRASFVGASSSSSSFAPATHRDDEPADTTCFFSYASSEASSTFQHTPVAAHLREEPNLRGALSAWKRVEKHRPWWWFPPSPLTRFAQEESLLLEDFLKHLLFEIPNVQLICELIM